MDDNGYECQVNETEEWLKLQLWEGRKFIKNLNVKANAQSLTSYRDISFLSQWILSFIYL